MGRVRRHKYEEGNIKKSILQTFSDPEVKKGIGSALIFLGIVSGVMGITFTAVAYGTPRESAHTFPAAGPCLIVVTVLFFGTGVTLVRHRYIGCFKTRYGENDPKNATFLMFCCFCEQSLPLYEGRTADERIINKNPEKMLVCDNRKINNSNSNKDYKNAVTSISGSLVSFSSLRNFKVYPSHHENTPV